MTSSTGILPDDFRLFSVSGIAVSSGLFLGLIGLYSLWAAIRNVYFTPLKSIPGPWWARASGLPYAIHLRKGDIVTWVHQLHEKYGDVVRVSPSELSFISGETTYPEVYGFRTGKHKTEAYLKDRTWFPKPLNGSYSLIASDEETHSRYRRNLSHAFSDKALRDQESIIQGFIDLFIQRLGEQQQQGNEVDIMKWFNYATFDIIADLTFGEPLYCLRDSGYHPWVKMVFASAKAISFLVTKNRYPLIKYWDRLRDYFSNVDGDVAIRKRKEFFQVASDKVTQRLEKDTDRPDFFHYIIQGQDSVQKAMSRPEMDSNAVLFLIAGSETTATVLSGATYLLLKNPDKYAKLVHEVRSKFKSMSEITVEEVNKLEYMIAALQEGMRYYPPVPTGFPRVVPRGGDNIGGHYIPEGTAVYVSQHAANHSKRNYTDPEEYVPERWLGDERYKDDNRSSTQPFSFGPRNCLGKNLAYAEMRLIAAKLLFKFDLELVDKELDWMAANKVFTLWEKPSLMVKLHSVQR
ncbi:cytochrome P450 monooxygenase-like protein [Lophiotrema nucula]|uniref:Cytochrome P450 monooxygenase-like protein n=1 Tax=Lophiotrema nucula TaxID=690887 RepID=A0A6A5YGA6_9PLEO|nr:cytochrome P450 monooxygenase-like protein [Lophiotrema nucula]